MSWSNDNTLEDIIKEGYGICKECGYSFLSVYKVKKEDSVSDGWKRYIVSYCHVSASEYQFVGIVRADGSYEIRLP